MRWVRNDLTISKTNYCNACATRNYIILATEALEVWRSKEFLIFVFNIASNQNIDSEVIFPHNTTPVVYCYVATKNFRTAYTFLFWVFWTAGCLVGLYTAVQSNNVEVDRSVAIATWQHNIVDNVRLCYVHVESVVGTCSVVGILYERYSSLCCW